MNCTRYRQLISRYVDDEVTPRQRQELLAHVATCSDCAAWLARARQTDVLLKSVSNSGPSDSVRQAILSQLHSGAPKADSPKPVAAAPKPSVPVSKPKQAARLSPLRILISAFLLRFDPSPRRIALGSVTTVFATIGLLYWLNVLPPVWDYNKLGFEVQQDQSDALSATPIPIHAVSSTNYGAGGAMSAPNLTLVQPAPSSEVSVLIQPLVIRFDQPMDRGSVEDSLSIVPPVAGHIVWEADNELSWTPTGAGLLRGMTYTVTLSDTALSQAGSPLPKPVVWSFHTVGAHAVTASLADGASVKPLDSVSLDFDAPMQAVSVQAATTLRTTASGASSSVPVSFAWDSAGKHLTITPLMPMPAGDLSLAVGGQALTQAGDTLGRSFGLSYHVDLPSLRVRLLEGRLATARTGSPVQLRYDAVGSEQVFFDIYAFPAEKLSDLGAQYSAWPQALPASFPGDLHLVATANGNKASAGVASISSLPAGIYLVLAHAPSAAGNPNLTDWQLLVVGSGALVSTGQGLPLWAVNDAGHSWEGAEISFYSAGGVLLDKGLTNPAGLLLPPADTQAATLAIARDPFGRIATLVLDPSKTPAATSASNSVLPATIVTDRPTYRSGDTMSFRAILTTPLPQSALNATLLAEAGNDDTVAVQLIDPHGSVVSALSLKPDNQRGVGGTFSLAATALPGAYTVRVRQADLVHDFSVPVLPARLDPLSVAILPTAEPQTDNSSITYTVSVLGTNGEPAAATLVTGTLGIVGATWTSSPVNATTNADGLAVLTMSLPSWFDRFNEPGIYLHVDAASGGLAGSDDLSLDFTSQANAASGQTQVIAPDLNVAVIAHPLSAQSQQDAPSVDTGFLVRAVVLDPSSTSGDTLLLAQAPSGERISFALDLFSKPDGDATFILPQRFAGGAIRVYSASSQSERILSLMPVSSASANLHVTAPISATASSPIPVRLTLNNSDGAALAGTASLIWARVSGAPVNRPLDWQAAVVLTSTDAVTVTLQTPSEPGLWYLLSTSVTGDGIARGFAAVRVLPGIWVQLPPVPSVLAGNTASFTVRLHNPDSIASYAPLGASARGDLQISGDTARTIAVPADGWADVTWQTSQLPAGDSGVLFYLSNKAGTLGGWPLSIHYTANPQTSTTYNAGALTGERTVGVSVPWGLDSSQVSLEIRASTSLLPALGGISRDLEAQWSPSSEGVSLDAARLSVGGAVASAYKQANATLPDNILPSSVQRSLLLQQLYAAQHADGSWNGNLDGTGAGSARETAAVLLAFQLSAAYPYGEDAQIQPDTLVITNALAYLTTELSRPLPANLTTSALDDRAYALYVLSLYQPVAADWLRPMLAYVQADATTTSASLSVDGQGWLALALFKSGNSADAQALIDSVLRSNPDVAAQPSASFLLALLQVTDAISTTGAQAQTNSQSLLFTSQIVTALMEARTGAGWRTPLDTVDILVALSLYSGVEGERVRSESPTILLGDRPIQTAPSLDNTSDVFYVLSGNDLRSGTNWLKLRSPLSGQTLYYSLTLIVSR